MSFVWFWTFWHWSIESRRAGALLRGPIHGLGSHWDEWFRHEASPADRGAIAAAGSSERRQRTFIVWMLRTWGREARWRGERPDARYILTQLAQRAPFSEWPTLGRYRESCTRREVAAIVLAEGSSGEATDIRPIEAVILPPDADSSAPPVVSEGFSAERADLEAVRESVLSLLGRRGMLGLLVRWVVLGARPYPPAVSAMLLAGWAGVAAGLGYLLLGPDPRAQLTPLVAVLVLLWAALVATAGGMVVAEGAVAWRQARRWSVALRSGQVRLRMNGGLTLIGGSAGLPFALATLLALSRYQAGGARRTRGSWLWKRVTASLAEADGSLAATGVVRPDGRIDPVVLEPKVEACLRHGGITGLLTPWQRLPGMSERQVRSGVHEAHSPPAAPNAAPGRIRFGYAAERSPLRPTRCRHLADALLAVGGLADRRRLWVNLGTLAMSAVMLSALPDIRNLLAPPPAPSLVGPSSASPYHLWVSLATAHPRSFEVVFESEFWANRRALLAEHPESEVAARAELRLRRLSRPSTVGPDHGVVWVERRRSFLGRNFMPGERVGRYTLSYLNDRPYE